MEVIILCGGLGTRLQSVVSDVPKPMADVNGKPFLEYIFAYLRRYTIDKIIVSVGYKQEIIKDYFKDNCKGIPLEYSSEDTPLGTGGAIKKALQLVSECEKDVLILNGDTFFEADIGSIEKQHKSQNSDVTIAVKKMHEVERYGSLQMRDTKVVMFEEKKFYSEAFINCGMYLVKKSLFTSHIEDVFSFETFLESYLSNLEVHAYYSNKSYFIDIGIPNDYIKVKEDFLKIFK